MSAYVLPSSCNLADTREVLHGRNGTGTACNTSPITLAPTWRCQSAPPRQPALSAHGLSAPTMVFSPSARPFLSRPILSTLPPKEVPLSSAGLALNRVGCGDCCKRLRISRLLCRPAVDGDLPHLPGPHIPFLRRSICAPSGCYSRLQASNLPPPFPHRPQHLDASACTASRTPHRRTPTTRQKAGP